MLAEDRRSSRRPSRKFKVPRWILAGRLKILWKASASIRTLIMLTFGYDPKFRNVDQSPFHGNEAGSAACNTISLKHIANRAQVLEALAPSDIPTVLRARLYAGQPPSLRKGGAPYSSCSPPSLIPIAPSLPSAPILPGARCLPSVPPPVVARPSLVCLHCTTTRP